MNKHHYYFFLLPCKTKHEKVTIFNLEQGLASEGRSKSLLGMAPVKYCFFFFLIAKPFSQCWREISKDTMLLY